MSFVKKVEILENHGGQEIITLWEIDIEGADIVWKERDLIDSKIKEISFSMISGDYGAYFGKWKAERDGAKTRLSLDLTVDWDIPSFERVIGDVLEQKTKKMIRGMLAALKLRIQSKHKTTASKESPLLQEKINTAKKFAFVIHPLDVGLVSVAFGEPNLLNRKYSLVKKAFEWLPSFQCSKVSGVKSLTGQELEGELIYFSLLPDQILSLDDQIVLDKAIAACRIAEKRGASIIGLGAYVAQIGKKGLSISKSLTAAVTTGTHYTIFTAIESVLESATRVGIDLRRSNISIVGATGAIGRICAEFFSEKVERLIIVGRNEGRLKTLAGDLRQKYYCNVICESDAKKAIVNSDISIMCTTTPEALVDLRDLRPGSLLCDISRPRNVSNTDKIIRKDVLVIDGGLIQPPGENVNFNFYFGLPKGLAYACMAETMILALEGINENYSLGGDVTIEKVKKIGLLAKKHGFRLAKIMSFENEVPDDVFTQVSAARGAKIFL